MADSKEEQLKSIPSMNNQQVEFHPKTLYNKMIAIADTFNREDYQNLVRIAIERGSNLENILFQASPEDQKILLDLILKYNIVSRSNNDPEAITLPRINLAFSSLACEYLHRKFDIRTLVTMEEVGYDYPRAMMTPAFALIIPDCQYSEVIWVCHLWHQLLFSIKALSTSNGGKNCPIMEIKKYCEQLSRRIFKMSHFNEYTKIMLLVRFGILYASKDGLKIDKLLFKFVEKYLKYGKGATSITIPSFAVMKNNINYESQNPDRLKSDYSICLKPGDSDDMLRNSLENVVSAKKSANSELSGDNFNGQQFSFRRRISEKLEIMEANYILGFDGYLDD